MSYVKASIRNFDKVIKELQRMKKAPQKVLDATMTEFRTKMPGWIATEVAKEYNVTAKKLLSGEIGKVKSVGNGKDSAIIFAGRRLTPLHFGLKPKTKRTSYKLSKKNRMKVPGEGVGFHKKSSPVATISRAVKPYTITWKVKKRGPKEAYGDYNTPWFLAPVKKGSSKVIPFQRSPDHPKGFATVAKHVVSVPQMVSHDGKTLKPEIAAEVWPKLEKRLNHYMQRFMGK